MPPRAKRAKKTQKRNFISHWEERVQKMSLIGLIATAAAIFAGLGVIMNSSAYVLDTVLRAWTSGPMPYAARAEVAEVAAKTAKQDAETIKQLEALATRQQQSIERGAAVAETLRDLQIGILKTKLSDAEADAAMNPSSDAARALVLQYKTQLEALEAMSMRLN